MTIILKKIIKIADVTLIKYLIVGVINTLVTLTCIFLLMKFGFGIYYSNIIGYVLGVILGFLLNTAFTFNKKISFDRTLKYCLAIGICYLLNLMVITYLLYFNLNEYLIQLLGMVVYTITGFALNKYWVMR